MSRIACRIAFLGPRATFTEQALRSLPHADGAELVPCNGSPAVLAAVRDGSVEAGCVPIENTVEGAVPAVLDGLVADPPLLIAAEALVAVRFAVLVRPGTKAGDVRTIASHPHGIAQTRGWIADHLPDAQVLMSTSTSEASAQVARGEIDAAVSAPLAAQLHGLDVLADDVADNSGAVTRFALVRRPGSLPDPTGHDRTSLAATTENRPGALLGVLTELAVRGIDLTRIESRPIKDRHAEYWFHLDCTGHVADPAMGDALAALHRRCDRVRFLGSYPRAGNGASHRSGAQSVVPLGDADRDAYTASWAWVESLRAGGLVIEGGMRLVLARHGQTEANVTGELSARPPGGPLTELGERAAALGARFAGFDVTAVHASTAIRAQQTAAPVAAAHGLAVAVVDGAHEIDVGELEGRSDEVSRERFREIDMAWTRGESDARMPGGESAADVAARVGAVVERITRGASGTVVLVSHGSAIRIAAGALTGRRTLDTYLPNTGVVVLRPTGAGWELESVDETVPEPGDVTAGGPAQ